MDTKMMYFLAGLILGVALCAVFPKIPIGLNKLYLKYKLQKEIEKNAANNTIPEAS